MIDNYEDSLEYNKRKLRRLVRPKSEPPIPTIKPSIEPKLREPLPISKPIDTSFVNLENINTPPNVTSLTDNVRPTVQAGREEYVDQRMKRPGWKQALINTGLGALRGIATGQGLGGALGGAVGGALGGAAFGRERALEGEYNMLQRPRDMDVIQGQQDEIARQQAAEKAGLDRGKVLSDIGKTNAEINKMNRIDPYIEVDGVLVDRQTLQPVYEPKIQPQILSPGATVRNPVTGQIDYQAPFKPDEPSYSERQANANADITLSEGTVEDEAKRIYKEADKAGEYLSQLTHDERYLIEKQKDSKGRPVKPDNPQLIRAQNRLTQIRQRELDSIRESVKQIRSARTTPGTWPKPKTQSKQSATPNRSAVSKSMVEAFAKEKGISYEAAATKFENKGIRIR